LLVEYKDLGTMVEGKIESGIIRKGKSLPVPSTCGIKTDIVFLIVEKKYMMMPQKQLIHISALYGEQEDEIPLVRSYCMYARQTLTLAVRQHVVIKCAFVFEALKKRTFCQDTSYAPQTDPSTVYHNSRHRSCSSISSQS
jgi:hypothetical protein